MSAGVGVMPNLKPGFIFEPLSGKYLPVSPCPFCGGQDISVLGEPGPTVLFCTNCGARGPNWDYREERAIPTWNERA